jgi:2-iminobutanoate/2-iminopropanoate deaminase
MPRQVTETADAPAAVGPYSQAIRCGDTIYTAGQLGLDPQTGQLVGGIKAQTEQALRNVAAILAASGASIADVVKTTVYLQDMADFRIMNEVYATFFVDAPPARSTVQVAALPLGGLVEIEAIAIVP